jgi:hypothetical protein
MILTLSGVVESATNRRGWLITFKSEANRETLSWEEMKSGSPRGTQLKADPRMQIFAGTTRGVRKTWTLSVGSPDLANCFGPADRPEGFRLVDTSPDQAPSQRKAKS